MPGNVHFLVRLYILLAVTWIASLGFVPRAHAKTEKLKSEPNPVVDFLSAEQLDEASLDSGLNVRVIESRIPSFTQDLRNTPSNITVIDEERMEDTQPLTFQEAVQYEEGIVLYDATGNGLDTTFSLRGFANSSDVVFLVDGVRVNEVDGNGVNFPLLAMNDIESVQIERGSASPVYGSGAFAGVVNLTTGRFSEKRFSAFGGLEFSSFEGINFNQGFSGTLADTVTPLGGRFKYYFNGGRDVSDGFRGENGEWRITNFNTKLEYELPEKGGRVYAGVRHVDDAVSNPGELTFQQFEDNGVRRTNKPLDGRAFKNTMVRLGADKAFWDQHFLASVLASWRPHEMRSVTTFGTFTDPPFNPDTNLVRTESQQRDLTTQLKYEDQWGGIGNKTLAGMEFRNATNRSTQNDFLSGQTVRNLAPETDLSAQQYNTGLFWRETLSFFDKVIPYFGMRHDFHRLTSQDRLTPAQSISERWHASTLSTGVTVKPAKFSDLFFNYSQGFRVPTVNEIAPFAGTVSTGLEPEESDSFEVGTRLRYHELAAAKTSFFVIDLENEIVFDSTVIGPAAPFGQNVNIAKSRRHGIEQRLDLNPFRELDLFGSYSWTVSEVRETAPGASIVDNRRLGQIPENRFTWGGFYTPFKRYGEPFDGFKTGLLGRHTGRQHPTSYQSVSQATLNATGGAGHIIKSYTIWDFIVSYTWREKQIYFKINNMFNERYYSRAVSATSFGTAIYPAGTFTFVNPGAPREFVFGSKWEF